MWGMGSERLFFILNFVANRQFFSLILLFVKLFRLPYVYFYNSLKLDSSYGLSALMFFFFVFLLAVFEGTTVLFYIYVVCKVLQFFFFVNAATTKRTYVLPEILGE